MKKLFYPLAYALTAFLILYSCSAEEEDTTPPPTVQQPTPEPEPEVSQYTLTVSAGEGGTVSTEGGTYDEGTEVTITATPAEGYEFIGWEGSDSTEASLTVTLGANTTLNALFERMLYSVSKNAINIYDIINSTDGIYDEINTMVSFGAGVLSQIYFNYGADEYLIFPGVAACVGREDENNITCGIENNFETEKLPPLVFKKNNEQWDFDSYDTDGRMWSGRNFDISNTSFAISDANEMTPSDWNGPLIYGEYTPNGIDFKEVTSYEEYSFFHDVALGDLNMDGLMDVVGTTFYGPNLPGGRLPDGAVFGVFIQKDDGTFEMKNDMLNYPLLEDGSRLFQGVPLGLGIKNIYGDERPEIITYFSDNLRGSNNFNQINLNNNPIVVFEYDSNKEQFIPNFNDQSINKEIYQTTTVDVFDLNNDGFMDIVASMEGQEGDKFDVWLGRENKKFTYQGRLDKKGDATFIDVNLDGYLDMILRSTTYKLAVFEDRVTSPTQEGRTSCPTYLGDTNCYDWINSLKQGINLKSLILLNDGNGNFNELNEDLIIKDVAAKWLIPYLKDNKLHFVGVNPHKEDENGFDASREIKFGDINTLDYTFYDITLNIF